METRIWRGTIAHTPRNPFTDTEALDYIADGGLAVAAGRIVAVGEFPSIREQFPEAPVEDFRGGLLVPGFVDAHVHFPQVYVIGGMGHGLLQWLQTLTLPEECRLADEDYARTVARRFLSQLISHGVTTALVFGSHFAGAQDVFFQEALPTGLRITSGLVVSDRLLLDPLHVTPEQAFEASRTLIERWHGQGRLRYAVTPRFALSASDAMLDACRRLLELAPDLYFTTHLNETVDEVATVRSLFPWARHYLHVYDEFGLVGPRSVFAHNVHPQADELQRLAATQASIAHCPSSNTFLGSGLFPMRRHVEAGVKICLGSDVGGGTGFSLIKEGLWAYQVQRLREDGYPVDPAHLLYLATRAGADALGLGDRVGDFTPGKEADVIWIRPRKGSALACRLEDQADKLSPQDVLGALFTLHGDVEVARVFVAGEPVTAP